MKLFIWNRVQHCSFNYHKEGGVIVCASSEVRARELASAVKGCHITHDELPDKVIECESEEFVTIFPDAGCC